MPNSKYFPDIKQNVRQRLQFIEVAAYYTGVISRSMLSATFGISDAAATKTLKQYNNLAINNLMYQQADFGFVPTTHFEAIFADLSPQAVLPMLVDNREIITQTAGAAATYGICVEALPLPNRLPDKAIVANITRAIRHKQKAEITYHSVSSDGDDNGESRVIEPHSLVNCGVRWHVRAYDEHNYDFRDFVLSRISQATWQRQSAVSGVSYDNDWVEYAELELAPHPALNERQRQGLLLDYGAVDGVIRLRVRRALAGYVLQKLAVDSTPKYTMDPHACQLILLNQEEIKDFAGWSFLSPHSGK